ncbi:5-hydroxytryptamine receptor-like [Thrips palmi]|uniref:5-hydroxytryptamine receptor-like n=1 Tax=Thrips palmi TaxID=161013 RepID=A0A6P8Z7Q2_THRPL|nr:5-hydroxytryptamine receptor-like [Thrips palmi]
MGADTGKGEPLDKTMGLSVAVQEAAAAAAFGTTTMAATMTATTSARGTLVPPADAVLVPKLMGNSNCTAEDCLQMQDIFYGTSDMNDTWRNISGNGTTPAGAEDSAVYFMAAISVVLGLMILITIIGNVFVIAAILLERNLQNVANYLIVSLAVADLMVACLVMPLGAVYEISQGWILGPELCDMWTSSDVLCCTASILHLVAIAVDRYWAVTQVDYIHTRNSQRIGIMILLVWAVALVVSLAPQFGWKDPEYLHRINVQQRCLPSQDVGYQIFATCSTFYVPLLVILGLYWKIFQTARKRIHKRQALKHYVAQDNNKPKTKLLSTKRFLRIRRLGSDSGAASGDPLVSALVMVEGHSTTTVVDENSTDGDRKKSEASESSPSAKEATTAFTISGAPPVDGGSSAYLTPGAAAGNSAPDKTATPNNGPNNGSASLSQGGPPSRAPSPEPGAGGKVNPAALAAAKKEKKESLEAKRERKAAKTLAIITGAFVVCWLPFFIMALVMPLCESCQINDHVASLFLWLGYFNSTLNPVIYTVFSPEFRQAFKRILYGGRHPRNGRGQGRARDFRTGRPR